MTDERIREIRERVARYEKALKHIEAFATKQCAQACAPYKPYKRHHSTECPMEYLLTAHQALTATAENKEEKE